VADEDRRDAELLGDTQQSCSGFAHLPDRAGGGPELSGVERLDGINHADVRPLDAQCLADGLELGLGEDLDLPCSTESLGA